MSVSEVLVWCSVGLLVLATAVFSAMETAFTRLSRARVAEMARDGDPAGARLRPIASDQIRYINLMLLLQTLLQTAAVAIVAVTIAGSTDWSWWRGLATIGAATLVLYVVVGVGARTLGRQHAYGVASATAGLARALEWVLGPIPGVLIVVGNAITPGKGYPAGPFVTEAELLEVVGMAEQRGVVDLAEREMIESVFGLGDTIAREVMVPRTDLVWIESDKTVGQALALALRSGFSRIPVVGENVDDVVGIAYLKDLAGRAQDQRAGRPARVGDSMRPAVFVPDSKPVDELLREMQAGRVHVAIVVDEYGGTAGLLTIEDILEEIVGEITDEYDTERPPVEHLAEGALRVSTRLSVYDLGDALGIDLREHEVADVDTVGGLLAMLLGRVPIPGASAQFHGYRLTAEGYVGRRHRIETVLVDRPTTDSDAAGATEAGPTDAAAPVEGREPPGGPGKPDKPDKPEKLGKPGRRDGAGTADVGPAPGPTKSKTNEEKTSR